MSKKQAKGEKRSAAATPNTGKPCLSRRFLADFFGLEAKKLLYAVAETSYNGDDYAIIPVLAVLGTDTYIDLLDGRCKKSAQAAGFKQDLYPAIVTYDKEREVFVFKSSVSSQAEVSVAKLRETFGTSVVTEYTVI